ncbi:hypothetical protein HAX54_022823 [Datura stramonium]|uniref:BIRD-IDD transcription factor fourth C2HC zinc finger domain-containing protein n=1 Tax=Datura stramonium TaxID=4076 RepID=A0ABS8UVT0_DATST|nr:hypothetical protein [Datura stramonium]
MIKGILRDDSMSNLTSASNEASISSSNRTEFGSTLYPKQSLVATANIQTQPAANKKKRNLPGNPEYRCDCGTLFSRRDSFITHRAFCDALAEESSRTIIPPPNPLLGPASSTSHHLNLHTLQNFQLKQEQQQSNFKLVPAHPSNELSSQLFIHHQNPNNNLPNSSSSNMFGTSTPHMSATALLQKAAQIGVTSSSSSSSANNMISATSFFSPTTSSNPIMSSTTTGMAAGGGGEYRQFENNTTGFVTGHGLATNYGDNNNKASATFHFGDSVTPGFMEQVHDMHGMMATTASLPCTNFDDGFAIGGGTQFMRGNKENNEGLTRDFLGLRAFPHHRDFLNTTTTSTAAALHQMGSSSAAAASFDHQNQSPWQN